LFQQFFKGGSGAASHCYGEHMLKRLLKNIGFAVLFVLMFNLLDFVFDRVIAHTAFTFDSLSNIVLPLILAILVIAYFSLFRKHIRKHNA
jgi:hypothetical protein